jgi:flagellar protein FlaJ
MKKKLERADLKISHVIYISSMVFWSIAATLIAATLVVSLTLALNTILRMSMLQMLVITLEASLGTGVIVFAIFFFYPNYVSGTIKTKIDKNLVYTANYMAILSGAGVVTEEIFTSLAESGTTYGVKGSATSVVRDIEVLGKDILSALDEESRRTPSKDYSRVLQGFLGTARSGGDIKAYLEETSGRQMEVRRRRLVNLVSQLNLAAEIYVTIGIAFPIIITTLLSLMGTFGGEIIAGLGALQLMSLITYVFIPIASIGILILVDGMTSTW